MNKDLTVGKPSSVLWKFCLPLFGSVLFQQLYIIADSLVAGKILGENALASVGNSYEITLVYLAFAFGCNIGCSVLASKMFGAKRIGALKTGIYTSMISSAVLCGILMFLGLMLSGTILGAINTPGELLVDSKLYLDIYTWGLPFVFFYNISNGIFSALGDSRTPFIFLAASSCANVGMDIVFVGPLGMGVAGVAWATFLCQGISCILSVIFVSFRLKKMNTEEEVMPFSTKMFKAFVHLALPSTAQQLLVSIGNIFLQGLINSFGASVMAGYSAGIKLNNLVVNSFITVGNGMANYTGQNIGAGKYDRIRPGFIAGIKMICLISIPIVAVYIIFGSDIIAFFMNNPSDLAVETGRQLLTIISPFYFVISVKIIADGMLRGAGEMLKFIITSFIDLLLRVVMAYVLSSFMGPTGIWVAWPIGWVTASVISYIFFKKTDWQKHAVE